MEILKLARHPLEILKLARHPLRNILTFLGGAVSGREFAKASHYGTLWRQTMIEFRARRIFLKHGIYRNLVMHYWDGRFFGLAMLIDGVQITGGTEEVRREFARKRILIRKLRNKR